METNVQEELCQGEMPNFGVAEELWPVYQVLELEDL